MLAFYSFGIRLFGLALRLASPFHAKARKMVSGRRDWQARLEAATRGWENTFWIHCSSLGEFEQGRPLIEAIRAAQPERKILLSFFSPSGYEVRKKYPVADHVCYLPLDTPANARAFIRIVRPSLAVFVKYDLWLNLLQSCAAGGIPVVLISALVRPESRFLKSALAPAYRRAFAGMAWIFTQDPQSLELLKAFSGTYRISTVGDTRFDRAAELPARFEPVPGIQEFVGGRICIVAGSPWPKDEAILLPVVARLRALGLCWIIAPHEIHPEEIAQKVTSSQGRMARYSELENAGPETEVLWIDNVGMLSRLYHYASVVYIGGGFGSGIHNTQEPAVYGVPVVFGPKYGKFQEAVDMVAAGGAVPVEDSGALEKVLRSWISDADLRARLGAQNRAYMAAQAGATGRIMGKLQAEGLL